MHGVIKHRCQHKLLKVSKHWKQSFYQFSFVQEIDKTSHFHIAEIKIWSAFFSFSNIYVQIVPEFLNQKRQLFWMCPRLRSTVQVCLQISFSSLQSGQTLWSHSSSVPLELQNVRFLFSLNSKTISKNEKCAFILIFIQRAWGAPAAFAAAGVSRTKGTTSSGWLIALHAQADGALHSRDLGRPSPTFLSTYKFCKYNSKRLIHTTI